MIKLTNRIKVGDVFVNPTTGLKNTVEFIETDHWYPGSNTIGNMYHLVIEGSGKKIQLTPAMISTFKRLAI